MNRKMKKHTLIVLADQKKVRFFHSNDLLNIEELKEDSFENHILKYSDRPGRTRSRVGTEKHALAEKTNEKERAEESLAIKISSYLRHRINDFDSFYLVTNPKIEGAIKAHFSRGVKLKLSKVIHKRLINKSIKEIWDTVKAEIHPGIYQK